MKESQAVTTTAKIFFEWKMQSVKEFCQIGNEISLILHGSKNQTWTVSPLWNTMSLLVVKGTTNKTNIFEKCKVKRVIVFVQSPKIRGSLSLQRTFPQITQKVLTTLYWLKLITVILSFLKILRWNKTCKKINEKTISLA